jgi:hypothetical protein
MPGHLAVKGITLDQECIGVLGQFQRAAALGAPAALFLTAGAVQAADNPCGPNNEQCDPSDDWDRLGPPPKPARFQPWQEVWQCNDVRVTVTSRSPEEIEYDLGGMIWGGSRFTVVRGNLFFNRRPCVPLRPVGSTDARWHRTCKFYIG